MCTALESRTDWLEPWLELNITRHYSEGFLPTTLLSFLVLLLMASCPPNLRGPQSSRRARVRAVVAVFSTVVVIVGALNHWRCIGLKRHSPRTCCFEMIHGHRPGSSGAASPGSRATVSVETSCIASGSPCIGSGSLVPPSPSCPRCQLSAAKIVRAFFKIQNGGSSLFLQSAATASAAENDFVSLRHLLYSIYYVYYIDRLSLFSPGLDREQDLNIAAKRVIGRRVG